MKYIDNFPDEEKGLCLQFENGVIVCGIDRMGYGIWIWEAQNN
jgi:hypothetical protein